MLEKNIYLAAYVAHISSISTARKLMPSLVAVSFLLLGVFAGAIVHAQSSCYLYGESMTALPVVRGIRRATLICSPRATRANPICLQSCRGSAARLRMVRRLHPAILRSSGPPPYLYETVSLQIPSRYLRWRGAVSS